VTAYRALAAVIGVEAERLWRALWACPMDRVRAEFVGLVDQLRYESAPLSMTPGQRDRLLARADQVFDRSRIATLEPDQGSLEWSWRVILQ
jgi:hypothetical protein